MAVSPRWGGGGNLSGGWFNECKTRDDLLRAGWKEAATLPLGGQEWTLFWRQCRKGESFRIRTEKYLPPIVVK